MSIKSATKLFPIMLLLGLSTFGLISISGLLSTSSKVQSSGTISVTALTLCVYGESACSTLKTSVDWGTLQPGTTITKTVYLKNTGTVPAKLSCTFTNWWPTTTSNYITLTWDRENTSILASQILPATFTLTVSPNITGITTYSVDININATQTP